MGLARFPHGLFVLILYMTSNVITIIIIEYKLKSNALKHTLAAFVCVALSSIIAYLIPVFLFAQSGSLLTLKLVGVLSASIFQIVFWLLWFKKRFRDFWFVLCVAFFLSVFTAVLVQSAFFSYVRVVTKSAITSLLNE